MRTTRLQWIVPVAVAALIGSGAAITSAAADGVPTVPARSVEQVLALHAGSTVSAFSGTVQTHSALGLPDLSSLKRLGGSSGSSSSPATGIDLQGLLTRFLGGENTLRVWADGADRQRVQLIDPFDELDVVHNGSTVWMYSSGQNTAAKASTSPAATSPKASALQTLTPDAVATRTLAQADPTTTITLSTPATVAGRATYQLVITPKTAQTLVDHVDLFVDATNGAVLQATVYARGQAQVALQTGFTAIDFARPEASRFTFSPPSGATITTLDTPSQPAATTSPVTHGNGWTTVVELPGDSQAGVMAGAAGGGALARVSTPVTGGRAIRTALLSVLLLDDGRTLVGAVPVSALVAAAQH